MFLARLQSEILPDAFNQNVLKFEGCEFDRGATGEDHLASDVVFAKVIVRNHNLTTEIPVVIKVEPFLQALRELVNSHIQFYNEVFMYSQVVPALGYDTLKKPIFPNFH